MYVEDSHEAEDTVHATLVCCYNPVLWNSDAASACPSRSRAY